MLAQARIDRNSLLTVKIVEKFSDRSVESRRGRNLLLQNLDRFAACCHDYVTQNGRSIERFGPHA